MKIVRVGQHNHGGSSGGVGEHSHTITSTGGQSEYNLCSGVMTSAGQTCSGYGTNGAGSHSHTITVNNAGSVAGTNAPYVQLRACKKD